MWDATLKTLISGILIGSFLDVCNAVPWAATSTAPSPTPSMTVIPWETKIKAFREYILQQPDQNAALGFGYGPYFRKTFADGECLQLGLYNWDCNYEIPYKMRGVAKWLDDNISRDNDPIWDPWRYYVYGYYVDPDNGWNFYAEAHLSFGACGNRGPQSSCGNRWCLEKNGNKTTVPQVPKGQTPYGDPNDRNSLCPWLRDNGTASNAVSNNEG
jgi:hypothetical protein